MTLRERRIEMELCYKQARREAFVNGVCLGAVATAFMFSVVIVAWAVAHGW